MAHPFGIAAYNGMFQANSTYDIISYLPFYMWTLRCANGWYNINAYRHIDHDFILCFREKKRFLVDFLFLFAFCNIFIAFLYLWTKIL